MMRCRLLLAAAGLYSMALAACQERIAPKVLIFTFFDSEGNIYLTNSNQTGALDFLAKRHRVPYASPQFPWLYCTHDDSACLITTGEAGIQATATTMAVLADPVLDLSETYFVLTGIGGGAPDQVTLNSIALARYSVQVSMQYEIDAREIPATFDTGYFPQGTTSPNDTWNFVYDSEVFEINANLRDLASSMIDPSQIVDTPEAKAYRANYSSSAAFKSGSSAPSVVHCDMATSDVWFSGSLLAESFARRFKVWTNGTGTYCITAQEDGAVLGALLRGAVEKRVDYSRIIITRAVSDFDRPYPGQSAIDNLLTDHGAFGSAVENVYLAGQSIAKGIIAGWDDTFKKGVPAENYIGDVWGLLGGTPDFGPGRVSSWQPVAIPNTAEGTVQKRAKRDSRVAR